MKEREFEGKAADSLVENESVRYPVFNDSFLPGTSNPCAFGELWLG
jgi:hypothetical protein